MRASSTFRISCIKQLEGLQAQCACNPLSVYVASVCVHVYSVQCVLCCVYMCVHVCAVCTLCDVWAVCTCVCTCVCCVYMCVLCAFVCAKFSFYVHSTDMHVCVYTCVCSTCFVCSVVI